MKKEISIFLTVCISFFVIPLLTIAQNINIPFALQSELNVEIIPTYPRPNEQVWINLSLYTEDLNSADIAWYRNGKLDVQGKGKVSHSFMMGNVGQETDVEIKIKLLSGTSFSKNFTLNPASIDLAWEASSYVPPFYKGKALHPRQGSLKIVAMPEFVKNGKRIASENLIYEWSNSSEAFQSQSGVGKNTLIVSGSLLGGTDEFEVLVTDPTNNIAADGFLDISPVDPEITFYENDPYYGYIFDSAIPNSFDLSGDEIQVLAAPFYLTKEASGNIKYEWRLNGRSVESLSNSRTAIFKKPEGESGQSVISLNIENLNRLLQQADDRITLKFEN